MERFICCRKKPLNLDVLRGSFGRRGGPSMRDMAEVRRERGGPRHGRVRQYLPRAVSVLRREVGTGRFSCANTYEGRREAFRFLSDMGGFQISRRRLIWLPPMLVADPQGCTRGLVGALIGAVDESL